MRRLVLGILTAGLMIGPASAQPYAPFFPCAWSFIITVQDTDGSMLAIRGGQPATEEQAKEAAEAAWSKPIWTPMTPPATRRTASMYPPSAIRKIQIAEPSNPICGR